MVRVTTEILSQGRQCVIERKRLGGVVVGEEVVVVVVEVEVVYMKAVVVVVIVAVEVVVVLKVRDRGGLCRPWRSFDNMFETYLS